MSKRNNLAHAVVFNLTVDFFTPTTSCPKTILSSFCFVACLILTISEPHKPHPRTLIIAPGEFKIGFEISIISILPFINFALFITFKLYYKLCLMMR